MISNSRLFSLAFLFFTFWALLYSCQPAVKSDKVPVSALHGPFMGQPVPTDQPLLFAPDIISTRFKERDLTVSPDGKEIFFTTGDAKNSFHAILFVQETEEGWTEPAVAPFSGRWNDLEPMFSPDGMRLYFSSKRPLDAGGSEKDWDIWFVDRTENGWGEAINPGLPVNTESDEYYPSVTRDGTLYLTSKREPSRGSEDIIFFRKTQSGWANAENAGDSVNSVSFEFNAFIAPDESYLLFSSFGRPDGLGGGDLYICNRKADGSWTRARNLGPPINSNRLDYCPFVSADGKFLFYTSEKMEPLNPGNTRLDLSTIRSRFDEVENGMGNVYWILFPALASPD
jgi:Tol biopolymer transport system component